jgi:mono/diheme cytochrome c family protein
LDGAPGGGRRSVRWLAGAGAAAGLIAVAVIAAVVLAERDGAPTPSSALPAPRFDPLPMTSPGGPPELSKMAPREAADRLFNRIMMASEQDNRAEALRFVPMAIQAYGALPALDRDAHFHLGLIHRVAGNRANLAAQIAALRQGAPNHLLALLLEHDSAEQAGDSAAVSRLLAAFAAAHDAEIAMARPEYEAHRGTIERFRAAALRAASSTAELTGDAREGADLFAKDCAACHGPGAAGSDKGPPLVDRIYEPSHHDDASFRRAVRQGVRAHHWPFGDMQPVPGVSDRNVERIIAYVRALQRAAGIR